MQLWSSEYGVVSACSWLVLGELQNQAARGMCDLVAAVLRAATKAPSQWTPISAGTGGLMSREFRDRHAPGFHITSGVTESPSPVL